MKSEYIGFADDIQKFLPGGCLEMALSGFLGKTAIGRFSCFPYNLYFNFNFIFIFFFILFEQVGYGSDDEL